MFSSLYCERLGNDTTGLHDSGRRLYEGVEEKRSTGRGDSSDAHSLVEEGKQVAHHHQRCSGDAQQDFADALRPLVHVLDPCSGGEEKERSGFIFQL